MENNLCVECQERPIVCKIRKLCSPCYQQRQIRGLFKPFSLKKRLTMNYGLEILKDLEDLQTKPYWNLADLGRKYGFSREWARCIFIKFYGENYSFIRKEKTKKIYQDELACKSDPRYKVARCKSKHTSMGAYAELLFYNKCQELDFQIDMPFNKTIDIIVNGFKVEIKSSSPYYACKRSKIRHFRFGCLTKQIKMADFIACYHSTETTFFIIPCSTILLNRTKSLWKSIYINEKCSDYYTAKNKYWQYKDAWHLLEAN